MKQIEKSMLLAEKFGANFSNISESYVSTFIDNDQYLTLVDNIKWASNFELAKSSALLEDFKLLNYNVKSLEEAIILSNRINYLSVVSSEEYYINPLIKYNFDPKTKSIGDLVLTYDGKYASFNDVVKDNTHSLGFKNKAIIEKCNEYVSEIITKNQNDFELTTSNKGIKNIIKKNRIALIIRGIVLTILSLLAIFVFISKNDVFVDYLKYFSTSNLYTYLITIYLVFILMADVFYIGMVCYASSFFYPYYYFKHKAKSRIEKLSKQVYLKGEQLALYMIECVKNNQEINAKLDEYTVKPIKDEEFNLYKRMYDFEHASSYGALKILYIVGLVFSLFALIIFIVIYIISKRG